MPDENLRYIMLMSTPEGFKGAPERIHDLATTVEADIPETSTRVFFLYRLSNGFTQVTDRPGLGISTRAVIDSRFDVQFRQALPFMNFSSTKWEMLFGVRNMFREPVAEQSVYDELLVVRPPKRLVGGITMLF
jgi:hypothetical protein